MIKGAIIGLCVGAVLSLIQISAQKREPDSLEHFTISVPIGFGIVGGLAGAFFMVMFILTLLDDEGPDPVVGGVFFIMLALCVVCVLLPVKKIYSVVIDGQIIRYISFGREKHTWEVKEIDRVEIIPNVGARVYMRGNERKKAFDVNFMYVGYNTFVKRMEEERLLR